MSRRAPDNADAKRGIVAYPLAGEPALEAWLMELGLIASHEETIGCSRQPAKPLWQGGIGSRPTCVDDGAALSGLAARYNFTCP